MKRILVSHSWTTPETHSEITDLLQRRGYDFIDRSVLPSTPLSAVSETDLRRQLSQRIRQVSTVVVAATEDAHLKPLVQYEIEESVRQGKRLVAVQPLGFAGKPVPKKQEGAQVSEFIMPLTNDETQASAARALGFEVILPRPIGHLQTLSNSRTRRRKMSRM